MKELLENAVDAGATEIRLFVQDAGKAVIQVVDNGKGMSETDARMAFERHATSKIKAIDDLFHIKTMGFRGEALASIAAETGFVDGSHLSKAFKAVFGTNPSQDRLMASSRPFGPEPNAEGRRVYDHA